MKYFFLVLFFFMPALPNIAGADADVTAYKLGMSPEKLHDQLVSDKFVFTSFKKDQVKAIKKNFFSTSPGAEFTDVYVSTKFEAKLCEDKVYSFSLTTTHMANQTELLLHRKKVFIYLKDNNAVGGKFAYSNKADEPRVVETYTIDRNDSSGSIRGLEEVKVGLTEDKSVTLGKEYINKHPLMIQYFFENKWFCPQ